MLHKLLSLSWIFSAMQNWLYLFVLCIKSRMQQRSNFKNGHNKEKPFIPMIPSARHTVPPVVIIIFMRRLFCLAIFCKMETDLRSDVNLCENNDHYRPCQWVYRVDQKTLYYNDDGLQILTINEKNSML